MDYKEFTQTYFAPDPTNLTIIGAAVAIFLAFFAAGCFANSQRASKIWASLAASVLVGLLVGFCIAVWISGGEYREARSDFIGDRIGEIEDTYGLTLSEEQFYELDYPLTSEPGDDSVVYGQITLLFEEDELRAQVVTLAWTGEEMVLLGSPEGAQFEELPRVAR